jgi:hypothetical protein
MTWQIASIVPVWVLSAIGAVIVGALVPSEKYLDALPPLAIQRKDGFVNRVVASIAGAAVILGVATAVLLLA